MIKEKVYDILIAGGGASGLMAALTAGAQGKDVIVLEQKESCGKKITATGNGKCNFTNDHMELSCYRGDTILYENIYPKFDKEETLRFFHEIGIYPKEKNGYYYPASEQAASVVSAFTGALLRYSVTLQCQEKITAIYRAKGLWTVKSDKASYRCRKLLIACGLKAAPKLGSDGSLLPLLEDLGHHLRPVVPALCGFYAKGVRFAKLAGVRCNAGIALAIDGEDICREEGELQLTEYGISGIPVFQISSPASRALERKALVTATIDFLPHMTEDEIEEELLLRQRLYPSCPASMLVNGLLQAKLAEVLLPEAGINPKDCCEAIYPGKINKLTDKIKRLTITLTKARDYEFAQICAGGIPSEEVDLMTLESKIQPGLYFAGEVLDIDGICGGYNLQWAWSSGYAAAMAMCKD